MTVPNKDDQTFDAMAWIERAIKAGMQPRLVIGQGGRHSLSCLTPRMGALKAPARPSDDEQRKALYESLEKMNRVTDHRR